MEDRAALEPAVGHGRLPRRDVRRQGKDAWSHLKHEAGPHRVQRVPVTESQGRVHTSAATVAVLPEAEEVDITIDPNDLDIDTYRSTGPGGQSVNTTDSAGPSSGRTIGSKVEIDQADDAGNRRVHRRFLIHVLPAASTASATTACWPNLRRRQHRARPRTTRHAQSSKRACRCRQAADELASVRAAAAA